MVKNFMGSVSAGVLIAIGGCVFLACDNRYVGAVLFSVALLCICYKGYVLYTGKVGYLAESHTKDDVKALFIGLLGNVVTTYLLGLLVRYAIPNLAKTAEVICTAKLEQESLQTFIRGALCGVLMYLAVSIYRDNKTPTGILFCVPVFILAGFEHSIADVFYFGASGIFSLKVPLFFAVVMLGNSLGGLLLPLINRTKVSAKE